MSPTVIDPPARRKIKSVLVFGSVAPDFCNACVLHLTGITNAFSRQNLQVTLMAPNASPDDPITACLDADVRYVGFPWPTVFSKTVWTLAPLFSLRAFMRVLKEQKPDLLYVRMGLMSWLLHWYANRQGVTSVAEHNGIIAVELSHMTIGRLMSPIAVWFQLLSYKFATKSRVVTEGMKHQLIELGASEDKIFVLGNGTEVEQLERLPRSESLKVLGLAEDKFYIGFLGSLSWWQGLHTLLEACLLARKRIPNLHLFIGGDGSEKDNLVAQAKALGVDDCTTFYGHVGYDLRQAALSIMDIATLPACAERNMEQGVSSIKIRDYAAVQSVILASDLPGLEDMADADALVLHIPDDPNDLAQKIIDLHGDPDRRARLAQHALTHAEQNYSWNLIGKRLLEQINVEV